jgi:hypothetical protein
LGDIADEDPDRAALRLLAKAIRGLPEDDQDTVWALLLSRAWTRPSAASREQGGLRVSFGAEQGVHEISHRLRAHRLLDAVTIGVPIERMADDLVLPVKGLQAVFGDVAIRRGQSPRQAALLRELSTGSTLKDAAAKHEITFEEAVDELQPTEDLVQAVCNALTVRSALPAPPLRTPRGPLQTIPVRLPEAQYKRLKTWSDANDFPMAVIVRGLLERFLDDQRA